MEGQSISYGVGVQVRGAGVARTTVTSFAGDKVFVLGSAGNQWVKLSDVTPLPQAKQHTVPPLF